MPQGKSVSGVLKTTGGEPEVLAPHFENDSGGWVLQRETVTNHGDSANQPIPMRSSETSTTLPRILLVGASVRWAAQSSKKAGFSVIGMDLFGDADTRAACDVFYRISAEDVSELERLRQKIDTIAERYHARQWIVGGLGPWSEESAMGASGPNELSRLCDGLAISVPTTLTKLSAAEVPWGPAAEAGISKQSVSRRWLVKQHRSCGGLGVRFWDPSDIEGRHAIESGQAFLQMYVSGHRYGLVAIANGEATHLMGLTRSLRHRVGSRPFVYAGSIGPCWNPAVPRETMAELSRRVAAEYSIRGLFNLDFVHDRCGQWWLLELNARPSGSCEVIERSAWQSGRISLSKSLMGMHIAAVDRTPFEANELETFNPERVNSLHLKQIVYAQPQGHFQTPDDIESIGDIPEDQTFVEEGHPIATSISTCTGNSGSIGKMIRANTTRIRGMVQPERASERLDS